MGGREGGKEEETMGSSLCVKEGGFKGIRTVRESGMNTNLCEKGGLGSSLCEKRVVFCGKGPGEQSL